MAKESAPETPTAPGQAYLFLGTLVAAYIGVYLCRKNMSVAVPILQRSWGLNKEQVGTINSVSTIAYAFGKFFFGPITDRLGGRTALLGAMSMVALFGALGAFAPGLSVLVVLYSLNRLFGSACWGATLKLVPEWFGPAKLAFACGLLSLSFVFGGALATSLAGLIAGLTRDSWQAVLGLPSIGLLALAGLCWWIVPAPSRTPEAKEAHAKLPTYSLSRTLALFTERKFLVVIALSFTLTLLRETFNFWTVDFIRTEGGAEVSNKLAAFLSTPFDLCGAAGIILMGWVFGRLQPPGRQRLLVIILGTLALLLAILPQLFHFGLWILAGGVGVIGFLVYGPYSLLGGVLSVEVRGKEFAATVSGLVDGTGYFAGIMSGTVFGKLLMMGGYRLGFQAMAGLTLVAAGLCCFLYRRGSPSNAAGIELKSPAAVLGENS
ncbi:MAG TPA: MFS transporter [Verrucomicrobiae bacterium]|nr:MFS transporter [Verrucomicrobiae bacterium]